MRARVCVCVCGSMLVNAWQVRNYRDTQDDEGPMAECTDWPSLDGLGRGSQAYAKFAKVRFCGHLQAPNLVQDVQDEGGSSQLPEWRFQSDAQNTFG